MTKQEAIKERRFQKMADEIMDYAIILLDEEGNIEKWNKGAEKIKGYTTADIIGKNFRIFYTPEARAAFLPEKLLNEAREKGRVLDEGWRVRKDGTRFWGNILITAIHDHDGKVIGFTKVTKDLTFQKSQEEKLRLSEERYHRMVNEVEDYAILLMDVEGNIENWNKGAQNIKGYEADEIIGKNFRIFYREKDIQDKLPEKLISEAVRTGRAQHEGWRVRKDGTLFWGNIVITALHDKHGNITGFSKVTRDLTDRKKSETIQKLEIRNKELEQFAYVASHDLQEPLVTIKGFLSLLREECFPNLNSEGLEYLDFISQSLDRMNTLIRDLLIYSRLGANRKMEVVNTNELLEIVQSDLLTSIASSNAKITHSPLPLVNGYKTELRQLFQNLLSNAIKFRKPFITPVISIHAREEPEYWLFSVKDNGIGFEEQYFERIFMLFQRLHNQEEYEGTGIGLAHCKKIVEMHDGRIWVESEPGKGSTFYFTLSKL